MEAKGPLDRLEEAKMSVEELVYEFEVFVVAGTGAEVER